MLHTGSITVAVRVRPPNAWEASRLPEPSQTLLLRGDGALSAPARNYTSLGGLTEVVKVVDDRIIMFDPAENDTVREYVERGLLPPGTKRYKDKRFMFDHIFDRHAQQIDVHEAASRPLLDGLLEGYNATVFAYGATGCGKTHTISGTEADPGIVYLTMADLFQKIDRRKDDYIVEMTVTFLEVYNEEIRDLLAEPGSYTHRGGLQIREDKTVKVVGLVELQPSSADHIKEIVALGNSRRTQSPTHANETSSRSHAVLQVNVVQSPRTASSTEEKTVATLSIIDLAGSERAAATSNMGQRMVEGANINKSLLALGNCINALCESGGATRHVPYRNSKLTRLLKFSLGGNCRTVMIVCIAPTSNHFDDTHNTLLYANRASKIKTKVVTRNVVNVDRHVGQYVEAINRLNVEVAELKAKLSGKIRIEEDLIRRRQEDAKIELHRLKDEIKRIVDEMRAPIKSNAFYEGRSVLAQARLQAIQHRLDQLSLVSDINKDDLPIDIQMEKEQLQAMSQEEQSVLMVGSDARNCLQRSQNSINLFNATMRAITERRTNGLDDIFIENRYLLVQYEKAQVEQQKYEEEIKVIEQHLVSQADTIIRLAGSLARCSLSMKEESKLLEDAATKGTEMLGRTAVAVSKSFRSIISSANESLAGLTNQPPLVLPAKTTPALASSNPNHKSTISTKLAAPLTSQRKKKFRRSSNISGGQSCRQHVLSPRGSSTPNAQMEIAQLLPQKSEKTVQRKKTVQWREHISYSDDVTPAAYISERNLKHNRSIGGSESEWEDERSDENTNPIYSSKSLTPNKKNAIRPRSSRLNYNFLKSKQAPLSILNEDEMTINERLLQPHPLSNSDIITNSHSYSNQSQISDSRTSEPGYRIRQRKSNIGPLRSERIRRRSSLLPRLTSNCSKDLIQASNRPKHGSIQRPVAPLRSSINKGSPMVSDPNDLYYRVTKPFWR